MPPAAADIFGARLDLAIRYADLLASDGVEWGVLGPREPERLWTRHLLNCAAVGCLVPAAVSVIDVGSGAGLPGIALQLARPDLSVVLVEPLTRRTRFLEHCRAILGLELDIRPVRAEALAGRLTAAVVTARALAPLDRLLDWTWPLVGPSGTLLAIKGANAERELATHARILPTDRVGDAQVLRCRDDTGSVLATVVRLQRRGARRGPI